MQDHLADQDSWLRFLPRLFRRMAEKWRRTGQAVAGRLGFAVEEIDRQTQRQFVVEAETGKDFFHYSAPTEEAVAAACRHTALLTRTPGNAAPLHVIGRMFGRIMYLVDAYQDLEADQRRGKFNPLSRCYAPPEISERARTLFADAHKEIRSTFPRLELKRPALAHRLLIHQLDRVGRQTFHASIDPTEPLAPEPPPEDPAGPLPPVPPALKGAKPPANASGDCAANGCDVCDVIDCFTSGNSWDCSGCDCGNADCGSANCDCNCS